jgi:hypothetical protein
VVGGSATGSLKLWDLATGKRALRPRLPHTLFPSLCTCAGHLPLFVLALRVIARGHDCGMGQATSRELLLFQLTITNFFLLRARACSQWCDH